MSDVKSGHRHKQRKTSGKSFLILPVMFFAAIYLILYFTISPVLSPAVSAVGMFFSDGVKSHNNTEYKNIFVPVPENDKKSTRKEVSAKEVEYPRYGEMFGELIIDDCGIDASLFMGDGDIALRNGVGIYYGSLVPGYGGTIMVAGHNNTYFNGLKNAKKGQTVKIRTSYGNYTYKIIDVAVKNATDHTAYDLTSKTENLVMYTCYPFDELGLTPKRCFVYAKFVSGPVIINKGGDDN